MRNPIHLIPVVTALGATMLLSFGCGGGSNNDTAKGTVSVTLVDGPTTAYKAINLNIQSVQIHQSATAGESGWITVSSPNKTMDLLALQGGVVQALGSNQTIGVGSYQMLRLVLGSGNTLTLNDGTIVPLTVPSGQQTGIKIPLNFTVQAGTTADVWIDFDGAHSIQMMSTGSGSYMLRPVVHGYMQVATGSVSGTLAGPAGIPLASAVVMAESVDAAGNVTILRTTTSSATGTYALNLLPISQPFYIVSQPVVGTAIYDAQASSAVTLTTTSALATANLTFTLALGTGSVSGTLLPMATATQGDTVYLLQSVPTGLAGTAVLVVNSANAIVGMTSETYGLLLVPTGNYQAQGLRSTLNADGTTTDSRSLATVSFAVTAGATTTQDINL
jgi:hypothetical protein